MKTLLNTTITISNMDEDKYTKLIDLLEDGYNYDVLDEEEFEIDTRSEEEKYQDWLSEQADIRYKEEKLGLI